MKNLQRIIDAYEKMDQRRRDEAVARMERIAKTYPMKPATHLRLVVGGQR